MMKFMFGKSLCIIRRTDKKTHGNGVFFFIVNELFTRMKTKQKPASIQCRYTRHDNSMHAHLINNITISLKKVIYTVFVQLYYYNRADGLSERSFRFAST